MSKKAEKNIRFGQHQKMKMKYKKIERLLKFLKLKYILKQIKKVEVEKP